jgi:hypothetical protein
MSRKQLEALDYTFVESDLPAIVRECAWEIPFCVWFAETLITLRTKYGNDKAFSD